MADFPVVPRKLALLNIDLQNVFLEGSPIAAPEGLAVLERVNQLSAVCRKAGVLVIHTAHVTRPDGSNLGVMSELIAPVREGLIHRGSPWAALHSGLDVRSGDIVLEKPRFGAFHGTDLELILRARGVDTIVLTGLTTIVCVDTTAREAAVRDFRVFVTSDGTATPDIEGVGRHDLQRVTCAVLATAFAQVVTVRQMIEKLQATAR